MDCASCKRSNRAGARFCAGCGGSLAPRCSACGAETAPDAQFCDACGASLVTDTPARGDSAGTRKVLTILFADLVGSTSLQEHLDAESTRRVMERFYAAMRAPVEAHGGAVVQLLGDGVMCVFGVPHVAEDDAIRAVRAAVAMQQAFREFAREEGAIVGERGLRIAVNTGEVVTSAERPQGIGDPLNVAGRLQQEAREGDVLIGEATRRLVGEQVTLAHFGTFALKGRAEPVPAYRVVSLERPAGAPALAFVGREEELRRLMSVYEAAVAAPGARLVAILGSPGLGKSRLLAELARRVGDAATVLTASCDPAGGATFAPLADSLRTFLGVDAGAEDDALRAAVAGVLPDDAERERIANGVAALLAGTPDSAEETFFVVRRLLAAIAAAQPLVLTLDDVQWAEPLLLDLTEHLVQWSSGVPLLVLVAARPELRDTRSSLAVTGGLVADVLTLGGLDAGAATRLAANVVGADELPAALAGRVLAASEGNPLFVGELVRMLVQDGALKREGDRWTTSVALADLEMPPTIQALLAARIERLRPEERTILERASVVGRQFSRAAVAQLLPREIGDLDARLESLRRSELVEPDTGWFLGEPALRFHHALIRDAAYRRVLRGTRAELHARFADWIAARIGESVEHDETIGWHLEQAHQHLRELGPIDARGRALGERAARYLAAAGRRALARDDVPVAGSLLGRALARLDLADPARADLALDWCEALLAAGEVGPAAGALSELARFTAGSDRLRAWHTCFTGQLAVLTDPQSLRATADTVAVAAEALASAGDTVGEAKAHYVLSLALSRLGKGAACEAALDRALAAARRADDRRLSNAVLSGVPLAALWGPSPVTRASGRCLDVVRVLRITQGAPAVEAVALRCQAVLEALRGRSDAARRMIASSRHMVEELGLTQQLLETDVFSGQIDLLEGDALSAERCLRGAYQGLREHGLGIDAARAAALLARALLAQGRAAEAESLSEECEALAGDDLQAAIAWRGVRAEALARRGEHARAVEFARAAVEIAAGTDALLHHADARLALGVALRAAGGLAEAEVEERRAVELWETKGASTLAERARLGLGAVVPPAAARADRAPLPALPRRRVGANAATAHAARMEAVMAARDADALSQLLSDSVQIVHHPTRTELGPEGGLSMLTGMLRAEDLSFSNELLATLGDSLVLTYVHTSLAALAGDDVAPFGAINGDLIAIMEVDGAGRQRRAELFDVDRLGDAIVRLYQLHAELLPDGAARARAAATARAVAALPLDGPLDLDRYTTAFAADVEWIDHRTAGLGSVRGVVAVARGIRSLLELTSEYVNRAADVLGLRSDALLLRHPSFGVDRAGGGAFERQKVMLWIFGADGLVTRFEQFDVEHTDQALARFDALPDSPTSVRRRVVSNGATLNAARTDAAVAARDFEAFRSGLRDDAVGVHHPTGARYEESRSLENYRGLLQAEGVAMRHEPLASLGDSLALFRASLSFRSASEFNLMGPVGAADWDAILLIEVDSAAQRRLSEFFAPDRLADATARLYQRHAELLPDGPARVRAEAIARTIPALPLQGPFDPDRYAPALAADVYSFDHRVEGAGAGRGAEVVRRVHRALRDLSADSVDHFEDILGLRSDALLACRTNSGTDRTSGGRFDRLLINLWVFGADGLVARVEQFDADSEAEALARFDALTAEPKRVERRVRPNAATANAARFDAAVAARDAGAFGPLLADQVESIDHTTGLAYDREGAIDYWRSVLRSEDTAFRNEPLAALGDSLALCAVSVSSSRTVSRGIDVGAIDWRNLVLVEVDADGRRCRAEVFPLFRIGDAIARLYERFAELSPNGPQRARATETARSVATLGGLLTPDRIAAAVDPAVEVIDHRPAGFGSLRGAQELARAIATAFEVGEDLAERCHDVLAAQPDALLVSWVTSGRMRDGGGEFEWPHLRLCCVGPAGRFTRVETFAADKVGDALARFDELAADTRPARFSNAAWRAVESFERAWRERDWDGAMAGFDATLVLDDRRALAQLQISGDEFLANQRFIFAMKASRYQSELLATRGERLSLSRTRLTGEQSDGGDILVELLSLVEIGAAGRYLALVLFETDDLDAAYAELDRRYAAGEGAVFGPRLAKLVSAIAARDWQGVAAQLAADFVLLDHRAVGWETLRGPQAWVDTLRSLVELAPDARLRIDHFRSTERGALIEAVWVGTREGGGFEIPKLIVSEVDHALRFCRFDTFDPERLDAALARYAELSAARPAPQIENLATRAAAAGTSAMNARDWERFTAAYRPEFRSSDRRRMVQRELDRAQHIELMRAVFETGQHTALEVLATRGARLALFHLSWLVSDGSVGPSDGEFLMILEADDAGGTTGMTVFDADDLDAAYRELDLRFAAGEAAAYAVIWEQFCRRVGAVATRDWDQLEALLPPDLVTDDHRPIRWGVLNSRDEYLAMFRALEDLAPDVSARLEHVLGLDGRGVLAIMNRWGTRGGGAFEMPVVTVNDVGPDGRVQRLHLYDLEQLDEARARFDVLPRPSSAPRIENLATRASLAGEAAMKAHDWDRFTALFQPGFRNSDRRRMVQLELDREPYLESLRSLFEMNESGSVELLATRGNRLALFRVRWLASGGSVGPSDGEFVMIVEAGDAGATGQAQFDADDLDAAYAELDLRYAAGEAAPLAAVWEALQQRARAHASRDWEQAVSLFPVDFLTEDHRPVRWGTLRSRDEYFARIRALVDLAPDVTLRLEHVLGFDERRALLVLRWAGTREGGAFEIPFVSVSVLGAGGSTRGFHVFDLEQLDEARACYEALRP